MKMRSTVLLGCITVLVSPTFARATGYPALAHTAEYVVRHWKNEFTELERQIKETGELYKRGQNPYKDMRVLDRNFCILPEDHTPFDVEYRRTHALVDLLEDKYDVRTLSSLRIRLSQLSKRTRTRPAKPGAASRTQAMSDYFEASEWAPSIDRDGRLIYSRWDYIDRENGLGSKFWTCFPDGRDPRAPHGNYPHPYSVQREYTGPQEGTRNRGACSEMHFRAIPNSHRYIFTGVPHHGAAFGPLALLDTRIRDKGTMNQITVITADQRFPESQTREGIETDDRILKYGTAWPLSEDFYICNYVQSHTTERSKRYLKVSACRATKRNVKGLRKWATRP